MLPDEITEDIDFRLMLLLQNAELARQELNDHDDPVLCLGYIQNVARMAASLQAEVERVLRKHDLSTDRLAAP